MLRRSVPFVRRISADLRQCQFSTGPVIFSWRSSPIALERMVAGDDLSGQNQVFFERWIRAAVAGRALNVEWVYVFANTWKRGLAEDLGWAFQKGLAGVLSRTCSVPMHKIEFGEFGIDLDTSKLSRDEQDWTDDDLTAASNYCAATIDDSLLSKYSSIDTDKFDLTLKIQPSACRLEFAYSLPLTKGLVAKDPSLKKTYRAMQEEGASRSEIMQLEKALVANSPPGSNTVFADVSIKCVERFWVREKETGKLVQGSEEDQFALHLVRFEMRSTEGASWKIVDWDDSLKGNVWH